MCFIVTDIMGNLPDERREGSICEHCLRVEGGPELSCQHQAWTEEAPIGRHVLLPRAGEGFVWGVVEGIYGGHVFWPNDPSGMRRPGPILFIEVPDGETFDVRAGMTVHLLRKRDEGAL